MRTPRRFLVAGALRALSAANALRPVSPDNPVALPSFFASWLTSELALHHLVWQTASTIRSARRGALRGPAGTAGLALQLGALAGLAELVRRSALSAGVVEEALCKGLGADYRDRIAPDLSAKLDTRLPWRQLLAPLPMRNPEVERVRNLRYADHGGWRTSLDVYRHRSRPSGCPVLVQVHGGGWVIGSKDDQARPLMLHLAAKGWVCVAVNYRLSPRATFPDHLLDLKHAMAWVRRHVAEYGGDPDFVAVTGGSAGGHLSSLLALTPNRPEYQPGFEDVDTSVQACVPLYGVYDFTNRHGIRRTEGMSKFLERAVMKASLRRHPERYAEASPMDQVNPDAPPMLVIHGADDSLVPVEEARRFAALLGDVSAEPVIYAELPGTQHGFEVFPSLRTVHVINGIERFLLYAWCRHLERRGVAAPDAEAEVAEQAELLDEATA
jgi:acetyl esterase/lipase